MAIINDIKNKYSAGSMLMRIIYINIAVFVVLRLLGVIATLTSPAIMNVMQWIVVSSNPIEVLYRPWTVITYACAHYDIMHILFNMLWLYWLGRIFMEFFTSKQLAGLYILGALGGVVVYVLATALLPALHGGGYLLGASASVMAIVMAISVYSPNYRLGLLFIGEISLKWIALVTVMIDVFTIDGANAGGHMAHLGGMIVGVLFAMMMRRGSDITSPLNRLIDKIFALFKSKKTHGPGAPICGKARAAGGGTTQSCDDEAELDRVLTKVKRSGFESLTPQERAMLFNFGKK